MFYKLTHWETWHYHTKYIPILPAWVWYCIRSGSPWIFTSSNQTLTFGGMEGESKEEMYAHLPEGLYPESCFIPPAIPFEKVVEKMKHKKLSFPIVVKPNVGMMGFMFRKIEHIQMLQEYHKAMPFDYIIQELIDYPVEVSVFYYRLPDQDKGHISGFLQKEFPYVTGNGISTLYDLMMQHEIIKYKIDDMKERHCANLDLIIPEGEKYILSHAGNRSQGGKMISLEKEINEDLLQVFDKISHHSGHFLYGRYDIKCASVEDLKKGKNFSILEFNGSGSGTQHVYGSGKTLWQACSIILQHWKMLYTISALNKKRGYQQWGFYKGLKFLFQAKRNMNYLKKLDADFPVT